MDILTQLLSISSVIFCLAIFAIVWILRSGIESFLPMLKTKTYWNEFVVPSLPIITGGSIAALITAYPYPELFAHSWSARAAFGIVCGLFCGFIYRVVKKNILEKLMSTQDTPDGYNEIK